MSDLLTCPDQDASDTSDKVCYSCKKQADWERMTSDGCHGLLCNNCNQLLAARLEQYQRYTGHMICRGLPGRAHPPVPVTTVYLERI